MTADQYLESRRNALGMPTETIEREIRMAFDAGRKSVFGDGTEPTEAKAYVVATTLRAMADYLETKK